MMVAVTFGSAPVTADAPAVRTGKSFFMRVFDAFAAAQMKRAEREIARYRYLLPPDFKLGDGKEQEPFGGW